MPAKIAGKVCQIEIEILIENIPLLLSKNSLKRCGTVIDMNNDKATIFNKKIDLHFSSSGHYCINIVPEFKTTDMCKKVLVLESELSSKSKFNQIKMIHAKFRHASKDSMEKILKDANLLNNDIKFLVKKVIDSCETCIKFRKPKPRPIVAFSKADNFNKTVSLDLHELKPGLWYFHMIDKFSRFSAAAIITNKSHCAKVFLRYSIAVFGAPNKVFSDNGGEFVGEAFHEMCERFNIKIQTTPAYSPLSNGVCETQSDSNNNLTKN